MAKRIIRQNGYLIINFDDEDIRESLNYWTEELINSAVPVKMPETGNFLIGPGTPDSDVSEADITVSPFSAGGRILANWGGTATIGSAQFCGDKNIILTAAHCFQDKDSGATANSYTFFRAYKSDDQAQKCSIKTIALREDWRTQTDLRYDYAFAVTKEACKVDVPAFSVNSPGGENVTSFGYPKNYGACKIMQKTDGLRLITADKTLTCMRGNPFLNGSSGGAWVKKDSSDIIGLNSFGYNDGNLWGPYFDDKFEDLFNFVKDCI